MRIIFSGLVSCFAVVYFNLHSSLDGMTIAILGVCALAVVVVLCFGSLLTSRN